MWLNEDRTRKKLFFVYVLGQSAAQMITEPTLAGRPTIEVRPPSATQ